MRHRKRTFKVGHSDSHRRCFMANLLKALIHEGCIETTVAKAKELKRQADRLITIAKKDDLASRRRAAAKLMLRYNKLTPKQARAAKEGDTSAYNVDRQVLGELFGVLGPRFATRNGGYTRMVRSGRRRGDCAETCIIEFLPE